MNRRKGKILNNLMKSWPNNTVAVYAWLNQKDVYRQLAGQYVKSGWIERIGPGAFKRSGESIDWWGGLYALQKQLGMSVHPAGKTALEIHGYGHYLPASLSQKKVVLFGGGGERLPLWFKKYDWTVDIRYTMTNLFGQDEIRGLTVHDLAGYDVRISTPERASLELCYDVPIKESFGELDRIMSGLTTLRPRVVQELLERCGSVKAKRLFMYLAEKHGHRWFSGLDAGRIDLGKGKRVICCNGRYDSKYKIVVPREPGADEE